MIASQGRNPLTRRAAGRAPAATLVSRPAIGRIAPARLGVRANVAKPTFAPSGQPVAEDGSALGSEDGGDCPVFLDREGNLIEVLCCDYGFRSGAQRPYSAVGARIPAPSWKLALANLKQEWTELRRSFRYDDYRRISRQNPAQGPVLYGLGQGVVRAFGAIDAWLEKSGALPRMFEQLLPPEIPSEVRDAATGEFTSECREVRSKLKLLTLDNARVWDRERAREARGEGIETPWLVKGVYLALCLFLDVAFDKRPIQRFWFLETVARMPYFSYISCLHLLETLGWWRAGTELRKVHFAEEWNELHHLQIMEALGGDQLWIDRFLAQHAAIVYYWVLVVMFFVAPALAYNFSELIEAHAVDTYGEFADANAELLKSLPPPLVAVEYYRGVDLFLFDGFQTSQAYREPRRPACDNLYDVFINIRDDEGEHVATMRACQDYTVAEDLAALKDRAEEAATSSAWDMPTGSQDQQAAARGSVAPKAPVQRR